MPDESREADIDPRDLLRIAANDDRIARAVLGGGRFQPLLGRRVPEPEPLDINDALRVAASNETFAAALLKDPERFQETFRLSPEQISGIRDMAGRMPTPGDLAADVSYE